MIAASSRKSLSFIVSSCNTQKVKTGLKWLREMQKKCIITTLLVIFSFLVHRLYLTVPMSRYYSSFVKMIIKLVGNLNIFKEKNDRFNE